MADGTELLYLRDAYLRSFDAHGGRGRRRSAVALDRTAFYPTGGGQPHDTGTLGGRRASSTSARTATLVWHTVDGEPAAGGRRRRSSGEVDWDRRHALMRTHTALHVLCGVIWNEWRRAGDRREHGAAVGPHGLRVRPAARGLRPDASRSWSTTSWPPTARSRSSFLPRDDRASRTRT